METPTRTWRSAMYMAVCLDLRPLYAAGRPDALIYEFIPCSRPTWLGHILMGYVRRVQFAFRTLSAYFAAALQPENDQVQEESADQKHLKLLKLEDITVIGPTPPGTGVAFEATQRASLSTSPTNSYPRFFSGLGIALIPTSITTHPSFNHSLRRTHGADAKRI